MRMYCQRCGKALLKITRGSIQERMENFRKNKNSLIFGIICKWCMNGWKREVV